MVGSRRGTARGGLDGQRQAAAQLSWVEVQRAAGTPFAQLAGFVQQQAAAGGAHGQAPGAPHRRRRAREPPASSSTVAPTACGKQLSIVYNYFFHNELLALPFSGMF